MKQGDDCEHCLDEHAQSDVLIRQQYRLDAPPEKVWRAISVPELRAHWLPDLDLAGVQPLHAVPGREIRYAMREEQPPFLASEVTLHIAPAPDGGTTLTIVHVATAVAEAANDSNSIMMCAA